MSLAPFQTITLPPGRCTTARCAIERVRDLRADPQHFRGGSALEQPLRERLAR
jgi:hypothetical protein